MNKRRLCQRTSRQPTHPRSPRSTSTRRNTKERRGGGGDLNSIDWRLSPPALLLCLFSSSGYPGEHLMAPACDGRACCYGCQWKGFGCEKKCRICCPEVR